MLMVQLDYDISPTDSAFGYKENNDESSVDTQVAFLDMLGLSGGIQIGDEIEDEEEIMEESSTATK